MKRELTCIVCPIGCSLVAEVSGGELLNVAGNTCPKGAEYAKNECISPVRMLTTTVKCETGELLPVKTATAIPKDKLFDAMEIINKVHPHLPINAGDVIIDDVFGAKIIAVKNLG